MKQESVTKRSSSKHDLINRHNHIIKSKALRYQRYDSLKVETIEGKKFIVETDKKFLQSIEQITKFQSSVFDQIIGVKDSLLNDKECQQIHFKAKRHSEANTLNIHSSMNKQDVVKEPALKSLYCKCGCERLRGDSYPMCCELHNISILGSGILLFFYFLKSIIVNLIFFIAIFDLFAIVTNLIGTIQMRESSKCTSTYCLFRDNVSDGHKYNVRDLAPIQGWLGLGAMVIWIIISRIVKYVGNIKNKQIDKDLTSASDFAIKITNLPYGQYNEQELVEYFQKLNQKDALQKQNKGNIQINRQLSQLELKKGKNEKQNEGQNEDLGGILGGKLVNAIVQEKELGIKSIQIIYNMEFSRKMIEKIIILSKEIKSMIKKDNNKNIVDNKQEYQNLKNELVESYEVFQDLRKKFLNDSKFRKALSTRVAIIDFKQEEDKNIFLGKYGKQSLTFFKQLKEKIVDKCYGNSSALVFKGNIPQITRAPEPSDIIWQNCQKKQSLCRILIIYMVTFTLILISLGIMVGLQYGQKYLNNSSTAANSTSLNSTSTSTSTVSAEQQSVSTIVNIIVSLFMQVINAVLWVSLSFLLNLEYNHTNTNKIVSQMTKSSVAMWINIIILPILVNYFINNRYYGSDGLSGIVFDYHISAISVGLVVKLLDPVNLIIKLCIAVKGIRNYFIKARYLKKNKEEEGIQQESMKKVYQFYEAPQFNIAEAYTYILSNILHGAFFISLNPFILILIIIQCILFYWICKFKVLKFCQIPKMTQKLIFQTAMYQFMLVPIFYGVGAIFNSYIANLIDDKRSFILLSSIICVGLGTFNYMNPKNIVQLFVQFFIKKCCSCCIELETAKKNQFDNALESQIQSSKKSIRLQTYYKSSNSLSLLGFQNILLGKINTTQIQKELQKYCQSHMNNGSKSQASEQCSSSTHSLDKDTEIKQNLAALHAQF